MPSPSLTSFLHSYLALTLDERNREERIAELADGILRGAGDLADEERGRAVRELLRVLERLTDQGRGAKAAHDDLLLAQAVLALKTLGRTPAGTQDLASLESLHLLLRLSGLRPSTSPLSPPNSRRNSPSYPTRSTEPFSTPTGAEELPQVVSESLRCLANVCLLHEQARIRLAGIDGVAKSVMDLGEGQASLSTRFLAARLLFLITVSGSETPKVMLDLVERYDVSEYLTTRLRELFLLLVERTTNATLPQRPVDEAVRAQAKTNLVEYLKIIFNVTLFFPRAVAERKEKEKAKGETGATMKGGLEGPGKQDNSLLRPGSASSAMSSSSSTSSLESLTHSLTRKLSRSSNSSRSRSPSPQPLAPGSDSERQQTSGPLGGEGKSGSSGSSRTGKLKGMLNKITSSSPSSSGNSNGGDSKWSRGSDNKTQQKNKHESSGHAKKKSLLQDDSDVLYPYGFAMTVQSLVRLVICLPLDALPGTREFGPFGTLKHLITAFLNFNVSAYRSEVFRPCISEDVVIPVVDDEDLPHTSGAKIQVIDDESHQSPACTLPLFVKRLLCILVETLEYYVPGYAHPDEDESRQRHVVGPEGENVDECLSFLLILLTKLILEHDRESTKVRQAMKTMLLADDIDRSIGLEKRPDTTGKLIRLLSSTYMSSSNQAAGKFLFALCDQDPATLAAAIGYGNASGFLQNINMLIPPPSIPAPSSSRNHARDSTGTGEGPSTSPSPASSSTGPTDLQGVAPGKAGEEPVINPITGAVEPPKTGKEPEMSVEEKEREAERLFVLFDRLNKTPNSAISVENPFVQAKQKGKFEETLQDQEEERRRLQELDDREEQEALEEMKRYKERKAGKK